MIGKKRGGVPLGSFFTYIAGGCGWRGKCYIDCDGGESE